MHDTSSSLDECVCVRAFWSFVSDNVFDSISVSVSVILVIIGICVLGGIPKG